MNGIIIFIMYLFKNYILIYSFNVFQELDKEALVLYESTIYELNITIKVAHEATKPLPLFADYIESWRVTCWETTFFKLFRSNDGIMKNHTLDKQLEGFQVMKQIIYRCI